MTKRRIVAFDVAQDGSIDVPEGTVIVSLEFESEGSYGYESRPSRVWVAVPVS